MAKADSQLFFFRWQHVQDVRFSSKLICFLPVRCMSLHPGGKLGKNLEKLKNVMLDLALERHFLLWYT